MSAASRMRVLTRTAIVGAAATAGVVLFAVPALAHVTITPGSAQAGSAAVLTFHIPNEESKADTTRVDMQIPTNHPIAQLLVQPVPGWTISVKTITLAKPIVTDDGSFSQAVSEVTWSGGQIAPGQFQDFSISADPLPQGVASMTFKTIQTYSNGDVVRWIDVAQPGQPEPDHPAPVLTLTTGAVGTGGTAGTSGTAAAPPAAAASSGSDAMALGVAVGGVVIGLLGLSLGAMNWRRAKIRVPLMSAHDGNSHGLATASAAKSDQEPRGGADVSPARSAPRQAGTAARGASNRKAANGRRRSGRR